MTMKHLLVHVDAGERSTARVRLAVGLAQRFQARLTGFFSQSEHHGPSLIARRSSESLSIAVETARAAFNGELHGSGVTADWQQLDHGEHSHVVSQTVIGARYADIAILGQHDPDGRSRVPDDLIDQILLHSGRPILVLPHIGEYRPPGRCVVVAWNGSREAARAVNDAIPLMSGAEKVTVLAIHGPDRSDESAKAPKVDIGAHLADHGIAVEYHRNPISGIGVADAILNACNEAQADLLVMGGYGQYGFPYFLRGSGTRHILRTMTLPVLMSH